MSRVDLWICREADTTPAQLDASRGWLSVDEEARWRRFLREEDRRRFLLARGLVRGVLARCTGAAPAALVFDAQAQGKPVLRGAAGDALHFNLSHTRGMIVLAVSRDAEVGVDVEAIDRRLDPLRLAARQFSANEYAQLQATADSQRHARFIELWTVKEAYVKALGHGLGHDLRAFSVSLDAAAPSIIEHADGSDRVAPCRCWLDAPTPDFRLALVVRDASTPVEVHIAGGFPSWPGAPA